MSVENGKVCCNCLHNIRIWNDGNCRTECEIDGHYITYIACMEYWCKHWSKEKKRKEQ